MADQADVESTLVALVSAALYPDGPAGASVTAADCRIYRGWPNAAALDSDLRAEIVNVTIFPSHGPGQVTTRYQQEWSSIARTPTLIVSVSGQSVTFTGRADLGQLAGILIDMTTYPYRTQAGDTPASVAANLAVLARSDTIVQLAGATLTIPSVGRLAARVVADARSQKQVRRQSQIFRVTAWCPTPILRDSTAAVIDQAFAIMPFIGLPDGSQGHLTYAGTTVVDQAQDTLLYRRDLLYRIEYPTLLSSMQPSMLFGDIGLNSALIPA